ncbi:Thiamine-phosphate synthase / Hydroxymethylpyrimidine/phosphomethylpyrimidine kinase [Microbacterium sp. 8M]|uniref:bifunctional hydroxymethylpyrimidine kinase/phosphomethylpyrimidine kinase n=1 Tax=Microbacterium sp. 8M TaxID=2653153 RepID=UPI0012F29652|nr:bifunctional hydroxymethylpyrimidine kinase/phosphomethylpyrimidine kinase [Microbacterium sp. 8M]VXC08466.1 Thiamine-phosphate synthase / Hydroxymethylpyrimidine/phosphomethylpyrimidine kinase [Microbacterium sp. 8M]
MTLADVVPADRTATPSGTSAGRARLTTDDLALYLVTDARLSGPRSVAAVVDAAVSGGVRIVQLRDKDADDASTVAQLVELSAVIAGRALLVVDDRLDAVVEARRRGARVDGVHLGQSDASPLVARAVLGPDAIVGLTANRPEHLDAVRALPPGTVDYLGVGVIRPTTTKADHPAPLGVSGFAAFAAQSPLPCVAIGGIVAEDVPALRAAGAAGVAVVSALCAAPDPQAAARAFLRAWGAGGVPRVLSIAGSDPSGGAGIQADLKAIAANGGYGMAAITALTAQNTRGVTGVHVPPAEFLRAQLDAIVADVRVDAVKIGMLAGTEVIAEVGSWLRAHRPPTVVLDPVMVATSGDRLLDADAERALRALLPLADLLTPNLPELAALLGEPTATDWDSALRQAQRLSAATGALVLAKGGHLGGEETPDALVDGSGVVRSFSGARIRTTATHGTGCSLSAALATRRAADADWRDAVAEARAWLRESIAAGDALQVGSGHGPAHHFAGMWARGGLRTAPEPETIAQDWWESIAPVRRAIDELPFLRRLADGSLPEDAFRWYLAQDALYLHEYARTLAEASRLAPTAAEQAFWARSAQQCIVVELQLHDHRLATSAAAAPPDPAPATVAYLDHLRGAAFDGDYGVLIAALLPCYWIYADVGARLHAAAGGDPSHPFARWIEEYADPGFAAATEDAIRFVTARAAGADPATRERMRIAFARSAEHERAFFAAAAL